MIKTNYYFPVGSIRAASEPASLVLPFMGTQARAGFPSPADDYLEEGLDLNELMVQHKAATFFCRAKGNSMEGAGIINGDILVVDRAVSPLPSHIVVAAIDGELVVKRFMRRGIDVWLESASPNYPSLNPQDGQDLVIWGVVTGIVRRFK
jgi:DNA polymerase V